MPPPLVLIHNNSKQWHHTNQHLLFPKTLLARTRSTPYVLFSPPSRSLAQTDAEILDHAPRRSRYSCQATQKATSLPLTASTMRITHWGTCSGGC